MADTYLYDLVDTWNDAGTLNGIKLNVTNTLSGASSKLMDLQIGGVSLFSVTKAGLVNAVGATLTGHLLFTDNTYDIGASGATRPRDIYLAGRILGATNANIFSYNTLTTGTASGATYTQVGVFGNSSGAQIIANSVNNIAGLCLASDFPVTWSSSSSQVNASTVCTNADTKLRRETAGVVEIEGASSALGFIRHGLSVVNDTNGGTLAADDVRGQIYTNTGASGGQTFNLPAAVAGMHVTFLLSAADTVTINPDNADQILVLTNAAGDAISCATQGAWIELVAIDGTNWLAISSNGTWTDAN